MNFENLKIEVTLSGTHWNKYPEFSVWFDDEKLVQDYIRFDTHTVKYEREVEYSEHQLKIRLENKTNQDTVVKDGEIVNDLLLNIDDITIDDISIGNLRWSAEYHLDSPQNLNGQIITKLDNCVNLGWNGTYILKFTSPFYQWLLEKL